MSGMTIAQHTRMERISLIGLTRQTWQTWWKGERLSTLTKTLNNVEKGWLNDQLGKSI